MEMQRHAQLMYTAAVFFDDISGIETVQIIAYAARVLQLAQRLFASKAALLEPAFLARLAEAKSTCPPPATAPSSTKSASPHGAQTRTSRGSLRHQFRLLLISSRD